MKSRVYFAALFTAAIVTFFASTSGRALAIVEYCGASVSLAPVGVTTSNVAASTYALTLSAASPRTVSGHVAVQTDNGWFDIAFNGVALSSRTHHYRGPSDTFTRTDFESPVLYASFSSPVSVRASFVDEATVTNEHVLGWDSQSHACAGFEYDPKDARPNLGPRDIQLLDPDPSPSPPSSQDNVLHPAIASAPGSTNCIRPFAQAKAIKAVAPDFPLGYSIDDRFISLIEVAVNASGQLDDAWVFAPSGIKAFDDSAIRAARLSTYTAPRSFCQDVSGVYIFRAEFRPH